MTSTPFVDFTLFMGMHASDERIRIGCKNTFIQYARSGLRMPLDHVGMCDHLVWSNPYQIQAQYYPFMDVLQSTIPMERFYYAKNYVAHQGHIGEGISDDISYVLLCNAVRHHQGILYTLLPGSLFSDDMTVVNPDSSVHEELFDDELETLYRTSLALTVPTELLTGVHQWKALFHRL